jgi:broad specificity polyphosphatase/5'/3'-nucleotidase SurE
VSLVFILAHDGQHAGGLQSVGRIFRTAAKFWNVVFYLPEMLLAALAADITLRRTYQAKPTSPSSPT